MLNVALPILTHLGLVAFVSNVGIGMGDPGVFQANPHPHPPKTHTHAQGMGFSGLGSWV